MKKISTLKWWLLLIGFTFVTSVYSLPIKERAGEVIDFFINDVQKMSISETTATVNVPISGTSASFSGDITSSGTGALTAPTGTTAQRPTPANGQLRYNTETNDFEFVKSGTWGLINELGVTTSVSHASMAFSTTTGTWTVDEADVDEFYVHVKDKRVTVHFRIKDTTSTGNATRNQISIPTSILPQIASPGTSGSYFMYLLNVSGASEEVGFLTLIGTVGTSTVRFERINNSLPISTNQLSFRGSFTYITQ